jgi:hypothetical protein
LELLTRRGRSRERKNSSPNDCANPDAGESKWTESAFHLPLGRGGFSDQMVGAFLSKKLRRHWPQIVSLADWSGQPQVWDWPANSSLIAMLNLSAANLIGGFVFGSIGFVAFVYGKRMNLWKPMFLGIALMVYPYFVSNDLLMIAIGTIGTAGLFFLR